MSSDKKETPSIASSPGAPHESLVTRFDAAEVRTYYETNTRGFLRRGEGGVQGAIHRAVWRDPHADRDRAFHYVDECLVEELSMLQSTKPPGRRLRFVDLGCGVGASLHYLLSRCEGEGVGWSVSPLQVELARRRLSPFGERARVELGDFCEESLPEDVDLAFGIESFVQASEPTGLVDRVARSIRPGGRFALCDDFIVAPVSGQAELWVEEFRAGWRLSSLMSPQEVDELVGAHGFHLVRDEDWTPYLALNRLRDTAIHWLVAAARPLARWSAVRVAWNGPHWGNYRGGNALNRCLRNGWVQYRFRVWERR